MYRLFVFSLLLLLGGLSHAQNYIPDKAFELKEVLRKEVKTHFPTFPMPSYFPALIEHESCIHLKHKRCWAPNSELLSKREQGVGLGQITRAYRDDGSLRFDSLQEMKDRYRAELDEVSWANVKTRADLQIRMVVLMTRDNYGKLYDIEDRFERVAFADASYNGGYGGMQKERRRCSLTKGCDAGKWFNHVEKHCLKSKKILYDNRNACDINRYHVKDVLITRTNKYIAHGFMY